MEVTFLDKQSVKIKGKLASFVVEPLANAKTKASADAVLFLQSDLQPITSKAEEVRLFVSGPGEYEVAGVKISGVRVSEELLYSTRVDGIDICIGSSKGLQKVSEKSKECQILVLQANGVVDLSAITNLAPKIVIVYGETTHEVLKALGKDTDLKAVQKFVTTAEKLPSEMEVVALQ